MSLCLNIHEKAYTYFLPVPITSSCRLQLNASLKKHPSLNSPVLFIHNRIPHLSKNTICEKKHKKTSHKRESRSALSQQVTTRLRGTNKTVRQYDRQTRNTNNKKNLQKKHCLGTVSKKITGGLKYV